MDANIATQQLRREAETHEARQTCLQQNRAAQQLWREAEIPEATARQSSPTARQSSPTAWKGSELLRPGYSNWELTSMKDWLLSQLKREKPSERVKVWLLSQLKKEKPGYTQQLRTNQYERLPKSKEEQPPNSVSAWWWHRRLPTYVINHHMHTLSTNST